MTWSDCGENKGKLCLPNDEEIGVVGLVTEERCANEVVVQRGYSLTRVYVAELHERRVILWLEHKRYAQVELYNYMSYLSPLNI